MSRPLACTFELAKSWPEWTEFMAIVLRCLKTQDISVSSAKHSRKLIVQCGQHRVGKRFSRSHDFQFFPE